MDTYTLKSDEVQLFKDSGTLKDQYTVRLTETVDYEFLLTNQNIVITKNIRKMFSRPQSEVYVYPVKDIKIYNDKPQVKQHSNEVEFFLTSGEFAFSFRSNSAARKLVTQVYNLVTGTSVADRGAGKVKGAINRVDDTLGINTVGTVKTVLENGIARSLFGGFGASTAKMTAKQVAAAGALQIIKGISGSKKSTAEPDALNDVQEQDTVDETAEVSSESETASETAEASPESETALETPADNRTAINEYYEKLELLTKMKSLVDVGILTQEEFEAKKKELLQL